jgi:hypothetical protein
MSKTGGKIAPRVNVNEGFGKKSEHQRQAKRVATDRPRRAVSCSNDERQSARLTFQYFANVASPAQVSGWSDQTQTLPQPPSQRSGVTTCVAELGAQECTGRVACDPVVEACHRPIDTLCPGIFDIAIQHETFVVHEGVNTAVQRGEHRLNLARYIVMA